MKYNKIENTDLNISSLSLGTWVFGGDMWGGAKEKESIDAVHAAIDSGINLIDTAPVYGYGLSESIIGKAIRGKRDKVLIATKCGLIGKGGNIKNNLKPESIRGEIDGSLSRLNIDYIDIYQCHWPDPNTPIEETLGEMSRLRDKGKIRYIGVSNFNKDLLIRVSETEKIAILQNQYSILERSIEKDMLPTAVEKGIGVITYGPLGGGILSGKYTSPASFKKADARSFFYKYYSGENFKKVNVLLNKMKGIDRPLHQIAINWVRQQRGMTSVIVGCRNSEQVKDNVAAVTWDLTPEQMEVIRQTEI